MKLLTPPLQLLGEFEYLSVPLKIFLEPDGNSVCLTSAGQIAARSDLITTTGFLAKWFVSKNHAAMNFGEGKPKLAGS